MGEYLIKPYEISVWEDELTQSGFIEHKLAIIGSDKMTGLNKVYNPVFRKQINGERTLTFSLRYQYFDPYSGNDKVINPFATLLSNERKVKLYYEDQWYEFIIKDHIESSDGLEWTYTCVDAFVLELSKTGYNITFDTELNNNQGTAYDLAYETLKNTSWQVGGASVGRQYVAEPIYKATLLTISGIEIINTDNTAETISGGSSIYLFYSYIKNQNGKFIQFIIRDESRQYQIDDRNVITDTNFRITTDLTYQNDGFYLNNIKIISWGDIENKYQANRLVYSQLNTYDPIMGHTVDRFLTTDTEIYKYTDYVYATSNVVLNYFTNGDNFNVLEDGSLQGWNPYTDQSGGAQVNKLELVTKPALASGQALADLNLLTEIQGFLRVRFNGSLVQSTNLYNTVYNSGFEDHASLIESISQGDKFLFRWCAGSGNIDNLVTDSTLRLIVAKYTQDAPNFGYYYKHIRTEDIILKFEGTPTILNNYITGGTIQINEDETESYIIDGVVQVPSTKYIYVSEGQDYVWNGATKTFVVATSNNYLPYYYLVAQAKKSITNTTLTDPTTKIGIFIYNTTGAKTCYIQDIQLTRYYEDENGEPVLYGNAPLTTVNSTDCYYIKPEKDAKAENIQTYASIEELAEALNISTQSIQPIYNENAEKYLTIQASHSNCFNILQTIAETFECWIDLVVPHDSSGAIQCINGKPQKFIYLREYAGKDNYAGFKYGINIQSIERNINSEEIITKLIVDDSQCDYVDEGYISIADASSNPMGESYILNFDYYYSQGLLNREEVEADKNDFMQILSAKNLILQEKQKELQNLELAFTTLKSKKNVYDELITTAQDTQTEALDNFYKLTGMTYEEYQSIHLSRAISDQLTEEETVLKIIGKIYTSSAVINNYSGILTNVDKEYQIIYNTLYGSEELDTEGLIAEINELLKEKEEIIQNFENKYYRFIQEGTWNSTEYIDSELYYLDAVQVSNSSAQPKVSYTIEVVEVSELEELEDYKFDVGDKSYIEDTEFFGWSIVNNVLTPAREEVIVSEVEWHLDEPNQNTITIQNYKTRFEDLFQRINNTVQTVQYNEATYAKISSLIDADGTINQTVLLESLNRISGQNYNLTSDGSVLIDGDNILIRNLTNAANLVKINSEGIRISSDGGQNWATAIDGQGINIGVVYTGTLNTNEVIIGNEDNPSFRWDKVGISAYKLNNDSTYDLQTYVRYDQYGLYGVKNGGSFKAQNLQDVLDKAHFAVTWDGFFIRNNYTDGRVEITSDNDFRVIQTLEGNDHERIKIGALEFDQSGNPTKYGININQTVYDYDSEQYIDIPAFTTGSDGNVTITGTINATAGNFSGIVNVGPENQDHIIIDGRSGINTPSIASSNYQDGAGAGWMINKNGDAVFNNITARGAIKTAVFEYAEIQAVGGIFIFRPSSTIRSATIDGNDLILKVEKPLLFKDGDWCKVSNYANGNNTEGGEATDPDVNSILANNGLLHVYQVSRVAGSNEIRLLNAKDMIDGSAAVVSSANDLIGGALVDMGNTLGTSNYGIGINSSDNTVNLPRRAISLFETEIHENDSSGIKVSYKYQAILGTLPVLEYTGNNPQVSSYYHNYMEGTQGIYTDNMYLGDANQYIAFYTDNNNNKQLRIKASQMIYEVNSQTGEETTWDEHIDEQIPIRVEIESSNGNMFLRNNVQTQLTCTVYKGNEDITNTVTRFNWSKKNSDGTVDPDWSRLAGGRTIIIGTEDVASKAIFTCTVEF